VKAITTGRPTLWAERVMPIASGVLVMVMAVIMSASVRLKVAICSS
jgi:hypothetical protein